MQKRDAVSKKEKKQKVKKPFWAWIFVVLCVLIPIISGGGAIPGAIGVGGAAGCLSLSVSKKMKKPARVISCVELTILCWEIWVLMGVVVSRLV